MARAWIVDLWVKDAVVSLPDGGKTRISATREQKRAMRSLPEHFRTKRWMTGKRWRVTWHEEGPNGPEQRARSFEGKMEADAFAAELEDDIRMGRYLDPSARERAFGEIAEEWITSKKQVKESTLIRYREGLDFHVLPRWGKTPIGSINRASIDIWVADLLKGKAPHNYSRKLTAPKLSPASVRHIVRVFFGSVMRYAVDTRVIPANPLTGVELPRDVVSEIEDLKVLSHAAVEALASAASEVSGRQADRALILLLAYCGPRINEALALQVGDVDLTKRRARIRRTWTRSIEHGRDTGPPKTWERRAVPLPKFLVPLLMDLTKGQPKGSWLFRNDAQGEAIEYKRWYQSVWVKALADSGAPDGLKIHDLRHTAASLSIAAGADVMVVQQMLGHKDATETLNTYAHLWPDRLDEVMDAMTAHREKTIGTAAPGTGLEAA